MPALIAARTLMASMLAVSLAGGCGGGPRGGYVQLVVEGSPPTDEQPITAELNPRNGERSADVNLVSPEGKASLRFREGGRHTLVVKRSGTEQTVEEALELSDGENRTVTVRLG